MTLPEADALALDPQVVLVVDDEKDICVSLRDLLEASLHDVNVLTADSGAAGLEILRRERADLVVTDYKMPEMNGIQFLAEARKLAPATPRVLITAYPDLDLAMRAVNEASVEHFLTKPLEPLVIVDVVRAVLYERRAQELRSRAFARALMTVRRQFSHLPP